MTWIKTVSMSEASEELLRALEGRGGSTQSNMQHLCTLLKKAEHRS